MAENMTEEDIDEMQYGLRLPFGSVLDLYYDGRLYGDADAISCLLCGGVPDACSCGKR